MKLSFLFYDHRNYLKMAVIWVERLNTYSRGVIQCFCNNLDPVHRIQTKVGIDILLDPRNKPAEEFFIFIKIQDGRRRSKLKNRQIFYPTNHISAHHLDPVHPIWT